MHFNKIFFALHQYIVRKANEKAVFCGIRGQFLSSTNKFDEIIDKVLKLTWWKIVQWSCTYYGTEFIIDLNFKITSPGDMITKTTNQGDVII